jgi:DNA-binding HxlR family transcriptional regulator
MISDPSVYDSLSSAEHKGRIEKTLDRSIFPKTYFSHLKMLVSDNLLNRDDSAGIGKLVFYSLTEEAKKRKPIRLWRTDPDYRLTN